MGSQLAQQVSRFTFLELGKSFRKASDDDSNAILGIKKTNLINKPAATLPINASRPLPSNARRPSIHARKER